MKHNQSFPFQATKTSSLKLASAKRSDVAGRNVLSVFNTNRSVGCKLRRTYLDDVDRPLCILLKQKHGGGVRVDVELPQ